jgi:hypothetical protein
MAHVEDVIAAQCTVILSPPVVASNARVISVHPFTQAFLAANRFAMLNTLHC